MLILLPPSEGKTIPESGATLSLQSLSWPDLNAARRQILDAVVTLCSTSPSRALRALGITANQKSLIEVNARMRTAPAAPAIDVYSGVLYEALDFHALPHVARRRADARIGIASALWGLVRPTDRIPAYRFSGDSRIPGLPALGRIWSDPIGRVIAREPGLIVDMRSGAYEKLARIPESSAARTVTLRILHDNNGKVSVVSHHNKATKGRIAAGLLAVAQEPRTTHQLGSIIADLGYRVEEGRPNGSGIATLDVIATDL